MNTERFVQRLLNFIEEHDTWTEAGLAEQAGLANSTIRKWREKKSKPSMRSAEKVCAKIGIPYEEFMRDDFDQEFAALRRLWTELTPDERRFLRVSAETSVRERQRAD